MAFSQARYTDARNSTFNEYQYHINSTDSLEKLKPVTMDASRRTCCLSNTRTDVLKFITDWVNDSASQQNVLWLHGLAGSGKSTLSTTIASTFGDSERLGAFLFFDRDVTERSDPTIVIRTLAHQLGCSDPRLGEAIRAAVERNSNILMSQLSQQFRKLILCPLSTITASSLSIVIVFDALDECGTASTRGSLLELLANDFRNLPSYIRTIVTSRAEIDVRNAFEHHHHILAHELDLASSANSDDILSYFRHRMTLLRKEKRHLRLGTEWPGDEVLHKLVQRASGLFVWASTASEFINAYEPRKRLDIILRGDARSSAEAALDALYKTALEAIDLWDDEDFVTDFRNIVGVVLVAHQPLSSSAIDGLLHLPNDRPSIYTISLLGCVLQQHPTVRVLHPSFADFLMTQERCRRDVWFFDRSIYHRCLAFRCFDLMDAVLERNMCGMTLSMDPANESLSEDVAYSCVFWIDHICAIDKNWAPVMDRLCGFLYQHLLHWFEAMSILKRSRDTISLVDRLLNWVSSRPLHEAKLSDLVSDACRFAQSFASSIEEHPLLVYMAALPFTPTSTALYQTFHHPSVYPSILGGFQRSWSPLLQILEGHTSGVWAVAISPDGKKLVSGSWGVRVWDTDTGAEILELRGKMVNSVAFSPDGTRLLLSGTNTAIRIYDVITGDEAMPALPSHEDNVNSVAFSPDGTKIVSGSGNNTLQVWNAITGAKISKLEGHKGSVKSVIFSSDGTRIISGSDDSTIRVWDSTTASEISELQGHAGPIRAVDCSPDGMQLVSGSSDTTIRIWDTTTGAVISELRGHDDVVNSVAFSPDGMRVASGSHDGTIRIWNAVSGLEVLPPLRGHDDWVTSVVFSPDGTKVISGSVDRTTRIWDVLPGTEDLWTMLGQEDAVRSLAFSSDGTKLVSGSSGGILRVWDTISGIEVLQMRGHESRVLSVNFSPDGHQIVSGSHDKTVRVWNATTGDEVMPPLRGHYDSVTSVAFSPDGTIIASGSADASVRVWDTLSGAETLVMRRHERGVASVIFSPDGKWIVSSSFDQTVRVWDAATGTPPFRALRGHPRGDITSVFFSLDGSRIIFQSDYMSLSWDAATGQRLRSSEQSDHRLSGSMYVTHQGWIVDSGSDRTLGKLPTTAANSIYVVHEKSLAVGMHNGHVLILHFPPALVTSPDTRTVEGKIRGRFRQDLTSTDPRHILPAQHHLASA